MKHEALIRKSFELLKTAWMPDKDREEFFDEMILKQGPTINAGIEEMLNHGCTEEQIQQLINSMLGVG
jgi:hypothetical protein